LATADAPPIAESDGAESARRRCRVRQTRQIRAVGAMAQAARPSSCPS
jgi:hypothetical protein